MFDIFNQKKKPLNELLKNAINERDNFVKSRAEMDRQQIEDIKRKHEIEIMNSLNNEKEMLKLARKKGTGKHRYMLIVHKTYEAIEVWNSSNKVKKRVNHLKNEGIIITAERVKCQKHSPPFHIYLHIE